MVKYDFEFSWSSTYGHAARLVGEHAPRGLVVDLGCGAAAFEQPMTELGFDYVGFEVDDESIELCRSRGIACEHVDLTELESAADRIVEVVGNRSVSAIVMLDVIEHLVEPDVVVRALAALIERLGQEGRPTPLLVVSIPNVGHSDLGAKLAFGRWDVTETGLLDTTHVTLFTEQRVAEVMAGGGLREIGRNDVVIAESEQRFPIGHPAISPATPVSMFLRDLRGGVDEYADTYQFVRCYQRDVVRADGPTLPPPPFLSVIVAASGDEPDLTDVLTCLAAQSDRDIEVLVAVGEPEAIHEVRRVVELFADEFAEHLTVIETSRAAPALERALDTSRGRYVSIVPDDRVLGGGWVAEFKAGAEAAQGRIVRCRATTQLHERESSSGRRCPIRKLESAASTDFDLLDHLQVSSTPLGSFAVPRAAIDTVRIGADWSDIDASAWEFVARVAQRTGVVDRPVTTLGCRPVDGSAGSKPVWGPPRGRVFESLDAAPILLPAGSMTRLSRLADHADEQVRLAAAALERIDALERSRYWRITAPLRWGTTRLHRLVGLVRRRA